MIVAEDFTENMARLEKIADAAVGKSVREALGRLRTMFFNDEKPIASLIFGLRMVMRITRALSWEDVNDAFKKPEEKLMTPNDIVDYLACYKTCIIRVSDVAKTVDYGAFKRLVCGEPIVWATKEGFA